MHPPHRGAGWLVAVCLLLIPLTVTHSHDQQPQRRLFGAGNPFTLEQLPVGKLQDQLQQLNPKAHSNAMKWLSVGKLEAPILVQESDASATSSNAATQAQQI